MHAPSLFNICHQSFQTCKFAILVMNPVVDYSDKVVRTVRRGNRHVVSGMYSGRDVGTSPTLPRERLPLHASDACFDLWPSAEGGNSIPERCPDRRHLCAVHLMRPCVSGSRSDWRQIVEVPVRFACKQAGQMARQVPLRVHPSCISPRPPPSGL